MPRNEDTEMDAPGPEIEASQFHVQLDDIDEKYPNRPRNHKETFAFHELYQTLFEPLIAITKKKMGLGGGWSGHKSVKPQEQRRF